MLLKGVKNLFYTNENVCVACTLGEVFATASYFGVFAGTYHCNHGKPALPPSHFAVSTSKLLLAIGISILNVFFAFWLFKAALHHQNKVLKLELIAELLLTFTTLLLNAYAILNYKRRVSELNGWMMICTSYDLEVRRVLKELRKNRLFTYSYLLVMAAMSIYRVFVTHPEYDILTSVVSKLSTALATLTQGVALVHINTHILFVANFYRNTQSAFVKEMKVGRLNVSACLRKVRRFYAAAFRNIKTFTDIADPYYLLWIVLVVAQVIVNVAATAFAFNTNYYSKGLIILQIRTCGIIFFLTYNLIHCEMLANVSDDLLSFLFKFPISKLRTEEAAQVEMLIYTLKIQKPVLKASDIFTVGTRLLAPISGTVVTYVLVALQFHKAWSK
ncbi:hypothetical protein RI129_011055 [Pyrocoelia pectoralis]|uniref:Gustatory receptor n=1 Tax=Pyrocoelia pectoralis TaxID=417401 RepID=A0AAN7VAG9_9COLE